MNLYHLSVADDLTGTLKLSVLRSVVEAAGGLISLSQSHGHGPAVLVILLPEDITPESLGIEGTQQVGHATLEQYLPDDVTIEPATPGILYEADDDDDGDI